MRPVPAASLWVAGAALLASAGSASARQQTRQLPVYSASVEVVRLHAAVLDGDGNPVTGLTAADFVVVDNGVEHDVSLALTPGDTPLDVALVFDQSDSIRQGAPTVKQEARAFLDALGPDDCALVLPFQHYVGPGLWGPPADPSLLQIIDQAPLEGGTSFNDAVIVGVSEVQGWSIPAILARQVLDGYERPEIEGGVGISSDVAGEDTASPAAQPVAPGFGRADLPFRIFASRFGCGPAGVDPEAPQPDRRKALVVLSDGVDTTSAHAFGELLGFLDETDVPVFSVAIGHPFPGGPSRSREAVRTARIAESRLKVLAESTGGKFIKSSGADGRLREAYDEIVTILRGSYLLGYHPEESLAARADGHRRHEVEVKLRQGGGRVFARSEYLRRGDSAQLAQLALRRGAETALAGRLDAALASARQAAAYDPQLWDAHFLEASVLWMMGAHAAAATAVGRALWLRPGIAASHHLAAQLHYELGDDQAAWQQAIRAQLAGADMRDEMALLAARSTPPDDLEARLRVPRVFVEGPRGDVPEAFTRLAGVSRAVARAASETPLLGLVSVPLEADYFLYLSAEGPDSRRPQRLRARLELYNYTDRRLPTPPTSRDLSTPTVGRRLSSSPKGRCAPWSTTPWSASSRSFGPFPSSRRMTWRGPKRWRARSSSRSRKTASRTRSSPSASSTRSSRVDSAPRRPATLRTSPAAASSTPRSPT